MSQNDTASQVHPAYGQLGDVERLEGDLKSLYDRLATSEFSESAWIVFDKAAAAIRAELAARKITLEAQIDAHEGGQKTITVNLDYDCHAGAWWLAAAERADEFPAETQLFVSALRAERATVPAAAADEFMRVATTIPGWPDKAPFPVTMAP